MNTTERFRRVAELFEAVRVLDGDDREAFLMRPCEKHSDQLDHLDHADVIREVRALLAHHDDVDGPLAVPLVSKSMYPVPGAGGAPALPARIGRYEVVRSLGIGGMGVVYLADQASPQREVAIKVIRPGLVTRELLRRFERETAILGRLQHPGIAQIYEAGTYDDGSGGRPYFAMEFVDGAPLSAYVRGRALDTRARLDIFAQICDAVDHAHQRGVIHRDLKPGNVLVDRNGQPKVLDFGVACATDADLQVSTIQTNVGQLMGTVAYMSPEQISGRSADIDARSDVYALGVIFYELLADRLPYDLDGRTIVAAARVISEDEPTALTTTHRTDRSDHADLSTIVQKALEKAPDRRYQSASALAADVRRVLSNEPILARPATTMYQIRKFARRHKGLVAGVVVAFLAIAAGAIAATVGMVRAQDEAKRAHAMTAFLESVLVAADSSQSGDVRLADLLRDAGARVDTEFADHPELAIRVHALLNRAFANTFYSEEAIHHARRWIEELDQLYGVGHPLSRFPRVALASSLHAQMQLDEAESVLRGVIKESHGAGSEDARLRAQVSLGSVLNTRGQYEESNELLRGALLQIEKKFGRFDALTQRARRHLGASLDNRGMHGKDLPAVREALRAEAAEQLRQVIEDEPHVDVKTFHGLNARHRLSDYARATGRYDEAIAYAREGRDLCVRRYGAEHPFVGKFEKRLARALMGTGEFEEAAMYAMRSVTQSRDTERDSIQTTVAMVAALPILDAAEEWETAMEYATHLEARYGDGGKAQKGFGLEARIWVPYLQTRLGDGKKAKPVLDGLLAEEAAMDGFKRAQLHYARGIWFLDQQQFPEAREHFATALELADDRLDRWPTRRSIRKIIDGLLAP